MLGVVCFALIFMIIPGHVAAKEQRLLIIGDSLSDAYNMPRESGWAYLLSERLGPDWEVVNAAISGETTAGAAFRTPSLLKTHKPSHVLIILGGNDGLRALSPGQVRQNLEKIVDEALSSGADAALMQVRLPASLGPVYLNRFETIYPEIADRHEITLLPFFLETLFDQPGMIMSDGIHPSETAQALMLEAIDQPLLAWLDGGS